MRILFGAAAAALVIGVASSAYAAEATSDVSKGFKFPNYTVGEQIVDHMEPLGQRLPGC